MNSIFNSEGHQEVLNRLENLNETSQAQWGKMSVGQMLKHCQLPLDVANGNLEMTTKIGFFKKQVFKLFKPLMYNDKPWKKNLGTPKEFRVTDAQEFSAQKAKLIANINTFSEKKHVSNWPVHPLFGSFTAEQWGKMQYKHLDHHLKQFGA